ncbi:MAG TPA: MBL fold metallo-hydrolase [Bryobacteraceae bacterium]|nr:MBL fold metallo-hydrolase [Bryobacteraceae bacterium]
MAKRQAQPGTSKAFSRRLSQAPETARFLRRAAPAFFREMARECARASVPAERSPEPLSWSSVGLHTTWLGHSTVLLSLDGFTILTDPVFSTRVGLSIGPLTVGIKRLVEVAAPFSKLPRIDLVLLSHAHMDHFDLPSLRLLEHRQTEVVTAYRTTDLLRPRRYARVHELRWNESVVSGAANITAFEVAHWGARMRSDVFRGYNGYVIDTGRYRIIFGGDTAYTESFRRLRSHTPFDLAIMPIGAYDPWIRVHCNPEQALFMAEQADAERILPVHHKTFKLSRESWSEPIERLMKAAGSSSSRVCLGDIGGEFHLS